MRYRQTPIYDDVMTIYNDAEETVILDLKGEIARLFYCDPSQTLLELAQKEAQRAEKRVICAAFSSFNPEYKSFLEKNGFRSEESGSILSVNLEEVLSSSKVEALLEDPSKECEWVPFRDLMDYQVEELQALFEHLDIVIHREELLRFDANLSGIVYDAGERIRAFNLASVSGSDIVFEGIFVLVPKDIEAKKEVFYGFISQIIDCGMDEDYERISFVDPEQDDLELVKTILDDPDSFTEIGTIYNARKNLIKKVQDPELPEVKMNYFSEVKMMELAAQKLAAVPFQSNINWKWDE